MGDGWTGEGPIDGKVHSNNCNCTGNSRPAVLKLDGNHSSIEVLHRGESVDSSVANAIAAGVSYDSDTDVGYVDIPVDDDNINRVVYEANSAVGLVQRANVAQQLIMVTTDGECCSSSSQGHHLLHAYKYTIDPFQVTSYPYYPPSYYPPITPPITMLICMHV